MKTKLILAALLLSACTTTSEMAFKMTYGKDVRTGLCFASYLPGTQQGLLTHVPCTPAVEAEIARTPN